MHYSFWEINSKLKTMKDRSISLQNTTEAVQLLRTVKSLKLVTIILSIHIGANIDREDNIILFIINYLYISPYLSYLLLLLLLLC